jgi:hypothetical protein
MLNEKTFLDFREVFFFESPGFNGTRFKRAVIACRYQGQYPVFWLSLLWLTEPTKFQKTLL